VFCVIASVVFGKSEQFWLLIERLELLGEVNFGAILRFFVLCKNICGVVCLIVKWFYLCVALKEKLVYLGLI
jgi:hypothetical protein